MVTEVTLKELLESGVYFGHPSRQFDPRTRPFLFGKRHGIYIIDIEKTLEKMKEAGAFLKGIAAQKKVILFVGTKKQAESVVEEVARQCGMPYVNYRWIGGTLTNFSTIRRRVSRLQEIEAMEETGKINLYTKKEASIIQKEKADLLKKFGGIRDMSHFPAVVLVVDVRREMNAIAEARKLGIPVVGIVDTNGNPDLLDYAIPANDDGLKSIRLVLSKLSESILEGKAEGQRLVDLQEKAALTDEEQSDEPSSSASAEPARPRRRAPRRKSADGSAHQTHPGTDAAPEADEEQENI